MTDIRECRAVVVFRGPHPKSAGIVAGSVQPYCSSQIETLAAELGGCVRMAITAPFTPNGVTMNPYLPFRIPTGNVRQVDINGHAGYLGCVGSVNSRPVIQLTLEISLRNGQVRDLAVSSTDLSAEALLTILSRTIR